MKVISENCKKCMCCTEVCPVGAISEKDGKITIDPNLCLNCGCCKSACQNDAIDFD